MPERNRDLRQNLMIQKSLHERLWGVLLVCCWLIVGYTIGIGRIADWLQPSFIGLIWAALFVLGIWLGGVEQRTLLRLSVACLSFLWLAAGFQSVTDFSYREALLFSAIDFAAGFMTIHVDQSAARLHWRECRDQRLSQFSLIDLVLATTVCAILVSGLSNLTAPPTLFMAVGASAVLGCCCSWMAYHWAWNDHRPVGLPLFLTLILGLLGLVLLRRIAPSLGFYELCCWLVGGPASVLAAQTFIVLTVLALSRRIVPGGLELFSRECNMS